MILSTAWQRQAQRAITLPEGSHIPHWRLLLPDCADAGPACRLKAGGPQGIAGPHRHRNSHRLSLVASASLSHPIACLLPARVPRSPHHHPRRGRNEVRMVSITSLDTCRTITSTGISTRSEDIRIGRWCAPRGAPTAVHFHSARGFDAQTLA
jgi:hypothetical protein